MFNDVARFYTKVRQMLILGKGCLSKGILWNRCYGPHSLSFATGFREPLM